MQTDELISLMAASHRKVDTGVLRCAVWLAALAALAAAICLVFVILGPRPGLARAAATLPVIAKALLGACVATLSLSLFVKSLKPGLQPIRRLPLLLVPFAAVAGWALLALVQAPQDQWSALIFCRHWRACLIAVPLYALLPLAAFLVVARLGLPTSGPFTGACAGLASGGLATIAYSLHCPDDAAPFLATWYTISIAAAAVLGMFAFSMRIRIP